MSCFIVSIDACRLERQAARIERDALSDQRHLELTPSARAIAHANEARLLDAAPIDGEEPVQPQAADRGEAHHLDAHGTTATHFDRATGERRRSHHRRGLVDEVASREHGRKHGVQVARAPHRRGECRVQVRRARPARAPACALSAAAGSARNGSPRARSPRRPRPPPRSWLSERIRRPDERSRCVPLAPRPRPSAAIARACDRRACQAPPGRCSWASHDPPRDGGVPCPPGRGSRAPVRDAATTRRACGRVGAGSARPPHPRRWEQSRSRPSPRTGQQRVWLKSGSRPRRPPSDPLRCELPRAGIRFHSQFPSRGGVDPRLIRHPTYDFLRLLSTDRGGIS